MKKFHNSEVSWLYKEYHDATKQKSKSIYILNILKKSFALIANEMAELKSMF